MSISYSVFLDPRSRCVLAKFKPPMRLVDSLRHDHRPQRVPGFLRRLMALGSSIFSHTGIRFCAVTWVSLDGLMSRIHFSISFLNRALTVIPAFLRQHAPTYPQKSETAYAFAAWHSVRERGRIRFAWLSFPWSPSDRVALAEREATQENTESKRGKRKRECQKRWKKSPSDGIRLCVRQSQTESERVWDTQQQTETINIEHIFLWNPCTPVCMRESSREGARHWERE